jgi:class 3 adenylate cyclase/tetratricopeptide (TPR) repeat protein
MLCPNCGTQNVAGSRFCGGCAAPLSQVCGACGAANDPAMRFCNQCGAAQGGPAVAPPTADAIRRDSPIAERRHVSVLFADLVGFTTLSESRDAEQTRELLSRYFELARKVVTRYGGTVEKFIGDAVMAVWGTPIATESDAERAVRAGLDLVASIPELDPALRARAGVLTGEAAVTIGAEGEGMVAGDLVNTASRIQTAAEPGAVLVGEVTRRITEQAIVYEAAGEHAFKGKTEPVVLWRAIRIVSGVGGALKSAGLEAPFVGRHRELKLIKDLFHGCAQDGRAHLVSVTGIAGIGKSRLAWEFYKYFDGIVDTVWWQRGRCLAYGDGVAYWALADMIRMRARIEEGEEPISARGKLRSTVEEHVLDAEERSFVEPRLAHLLGLAEVTTGDRQDLFAAWRMFFERLARSAPTVLAFEDLQWADSSLLDFVEYLLEWSRDYPIYVITLARPELQERRPSWGAGQRNFTSLYLEPLSPLAMEELLEGLVPGLPTGLRTQILGRAQGVPLYAVETVRMLLDRGLVVQEGAAYRPRGEIAALEVPETLHALIAARLDGLSGEERRVLQDGAVLGKTFAKPALAALSGMQPDLLEPLVAALVRKEVLGVQLDPRSPERGQYGFLQDLVRHVAYETLAKRDRKVRHLAAAAHLEQAFSQEDGVVEVLASHYLAAFEAAPEAEDAPAIKTRTREMLTRAGERAGSIGAPEEGRNYYEQAAALSEDPLDEARLLEQAGQLATEANRPIEARERLERALNLYSVGSDTRATARVSVALAEVDMTVGRYDEASRRLEEAIADLEAGAPSPELAAALAQLGRVHALGGRNEEAVAALDRALTLSERLLLPEVFVEALTSRGVSVVSQGRLIEARILLEAAAARADSEQLYASELRAQNNLAYVLEASDSYSDALEFCDRAIALARRRGDRRWESVLRTGSIVQLYLQGRWDEALAIAAEEEPHIAADVAGFNLLFIAFVHCERGDAKRGRAAFVAARPSLRSGSDPAMRAGFAAIEARVLRAEGRPEEALVSAQHALGLAGDLEFTDTGIKLVVVEAIEAALVLVDLDKADELLRIPESLDAGQLTPMLQAHVARLRARFNTVRGEEHEVDTGFRKAARLFQELGMGFHWAVTQLEHAEWLAECGRDDAAHPLLVEAGDSFEALRATPWLERIARMTVSREEPAAASS